jgi:hypothetical protein
MRHVIIHAHIFKNAGSTLDYSFQNSFGTNFLDDRNDLEMEQSNQKYIETLLNLNTHLLCISSHRIFFKLANSDLYKFHQIYLLRHPLYRAFSVYQFERNQPELNTPGSLIAKKLNFKEFVEWYLDKLNPPTIRNCQSIFLAANGIDFLEETTLQLAINNLKENPLIGIVEKYDQSTLYFESLLKPYFPSIDFSYISQNVSPNKIANNTKNSMDFLISSLGDIYQDFIKANTQDYYLYDLANDLLTERCDFLNFKKSTSNAY